MKNPRVCPDTVLARLSGRTTPSLSGQGREEGGVEVPVSGAGFWVDRNGADRGVTVRLGTAVAMRARFGGWPVIAQDVKSKHQPASDSVLTKSCHGCFCESVIRSEEGTAVFRKRSVLKNPARPGGTQLTGRRGRLLRVV